VEFTLDNFKAMYRDVAQLTDEVRILASKFNALAIEAANEHKKLEWREAQITGLFDILKSGDEAKDVPMKAIIDSHFGLRKD
jgi:hypothetical protein